MCPDSLERRVDEVAARSRGSEVRPYRRRFRSGGGTWKWARSGRTLAPGPLPLETLSPDGVFHRPSPDADLRFVAVPPPADEDVLDVTFDTYIRVSELLRRRGIHLWDDPSGQAEGEADDQRDPLAEASPALAHLCAAGPPSPSTPTPDARPDASAMPPPTGAPTSHYRVSLGRGWRAWTSTPASPSPRASASAWSISVATAPAPRTGPKSGSAGIARGSGPRSPCWTPPGPAESRLRPPGETNELTYRGLLRGADYVPRPNPRDPGAFGAGISMRSCPVFHAPR